MALLSYGKLIISRLFLPDLINKNFLCEKSYLLFISSME
ncbi:hypothetical protein ED5_3177 [Enterobacter roggenkampii]|nr:hypothetical protein ED5_3177 [Enterobacter roggenkampii]